MIRSDLPIGKSPLRGWHVILIISCLCLIIFALTSALFRTADGSRDYIFPKELIVKLTPPPLSEVSSPTNEEIYKGILQIDSMTRELYQIEVESSQGGNQIKMFFSLSSWHRPYNCAVYFLSFIFAFSLLFFIRKNKNKLNGWKRRYLTANKLQYIIPIGLVICLFLAILNLSVPFKSGYNTIADPFFFFICWLCVFSFMACFEKMFRMTRNPRFWSSSRITRNEHRKNALISAAISGWLLAFLVFFIGMYTIGTQKSLLSILLRPALSATKMFVLADSAGDLSYVFRQNGAFMGFYSVTKLYVLLITSTSLLSLIWYRIDNYIKIKNVSAKNKTLYVFFGINENSKQLARSISESIVNNKDLQNYILLFIESRETSSNQFVESPSVTSFFNMFKFRRDAFEDIEDMHAHLIISSVPISSKECCDRVQKDDSKDFQANIWEDLGLVKLQTMIDEALAVHMFLISNEEKENIIGTSNINHILLSSWNNKKNNAEGNKKVILYCHARYNSIHRVIEDELTNEDIKIKVVDSSHISVELIKKDPMLHPVNYVKVEHDATVSSDFNSLVIGFGEVGLDAVRFLYEYGAFVKYHCFKGLIERSGFHCYVVDKRMDDLAGVFSANTPSISMTINKRKIENAQFINLYNIDCHSIDFYQRLNQWIETLNYVVVATDDDETNISLAVRILLLAIRNRKDDLSRLRILVRVQHDENEHIQKIAWHYNRLWAAEKNGIENEKKLHQDTVSSFEIVDEPITLFGSAIQVYTYEHIVNESLKEDAKNYKERYDLSVNEFRRLAGEKTYPTQSWDEEQNDLMQLSGQRKGYAPTLSGIMKLRRVQNQNISNSLHAQTKIALAKAALGEDFDNIQINGLVRSAGSNTYRWRNRANKPIEHIQRVLDVLAQTEHLRWNASHEILGYQVEGDENFKDEARLKHGCLKTWDKLSEKMQSNDYDVVDVSLMNM